MRRLPPLAAIRAFEAAARNESFTAAAAELGLTQAAVSYQVKALEERLGAPLFLRERGRATDEEERTDDRKRGEAAGATAHAIQEARWIGHGAKLQPCG